MMYKNTATGVIWTEEEVRKSFEDFRYEMDTKWIDFEEYLNHMLHIGEFEEEE